MHDHTNPDQPGDADQLDAETLDTTAPGPTGDNLTPLLVGLIGAVLLLGVLLVLFSTGTEPSTEPPQPAATGTDEQAEDQADDGPADGGPEADTPSAADEPAAVNEVVAWHDDVAPVIAQLLNILTEPPSDDPDRITSSCEQIALSVRGLAEVEPAPDADVEDAFRTWERQLGNAADSCDEITTAQEYEAAFLGTSVAFHTLMDELAVYVDFDAEPAPPGGAVPGSPAVSADTD